MMMWCWKALNLKRRQSLSSEQKRKRRRRSGRSWRCWIVLLPSTLWNEDISVKNTSKQACAARFSRLTGCGFVLQGLLSVIHVFRETVSCHLGRVFLTLFPKAKTNGRD